MKRLEQLFSTVALLVALGWPLTAAADPFPVQIATGSLEMGSGGGLLSLAGDQGFTFAGGVTVTGGLFGPRNACTPCLPGQPVSLLSTWGGNDLAGTATFQGQTYTQVGSLAPGHASGMVTFSGPAPLAPPLQGFSSTVTAPFDFTGQFWFPAQGGAADASVSLFGAGTASVELFRSSLDIPWSYSRATYTFADPVPEPGTMLLVGTVLAGLAAGRRLKRR
jgi:hypothetical protein